jgi:hypothetical protein
MMQESARRDAVEVAIAEEERQQETSKYRVCGSRRVAH